MKQYLLLFVTFCSFSLLATESEDIYNARVLGQEIISQNYSRLVEITGSESQAHASYTACFKNPAGSSFARPQKQFYCSIPFSFRLCYTPKLLIDGKADREKALKNFKLCETKTKIQYTGKQDGFEDVLMNLFFEDANKIIVGKDYNFESVPEIDEEQSFLRSLFDLVYVEVKAGEISMCTRYMRSQNKDPSSCGTL